MVLHGLGLPLQDILPLVLLAQSAGGGGAACLHRAPINVLSAVVAQCQKQLSGANLFPNAAAMSIYKLHW